MTGASRVTANERRFYGVAEALVRRVDDPERLGRVTVVYPWFDGGRTESDWCRVAQLYAGPEYGAVFVPEEDTEVLVAFVHGDMRVPIVLGGLYNGPQKPPTARRDEDRKMIRTKHGHELVFDDTEGAEGLWLKTKDEHELTISDSAGTITVAAKSGPSIVIDKTGTITLDSSNGQTITLDSSGVTIAGATIKLDSSQVSLGQGAAQKVVLGDMFMALFNSHVHPTSSPGAPTAPTTMPMTPAMLSSVTKTA